MPKTSLSRLLLGALASTFTLTSLVGCSGGADADLPKVEGQFGAPPKIQSATAKSPAKELKVKELIAGKGKPCGKNAVVNVGYLGKVWKGETFESTWDRGETTIFPLDQVITGWKESLSKAKKGSRMLVSIPPEKAYGQEAQGKIPANSTLVFVVDVFDCYGPKHISKSLKTAKPTGKTIEGVTVSGNLAEKPILKVDPAKVKTDKLSLVVAYEGSGKKITEKDIVLAHVTKIGSDGKNGQSSWDKKVIVPLDSKQLKELAGKRIGSRLYGVLPGQKQGGPAAVVVIDLAAKMRPKKLQK